MRRVLAYCGFLENDHLPLPQTGVSQSSVQVLAQHHLRLLWSEIEWPFEPTRLQQSAVEFHEVIHSVFRRAAVVPFRLLSIFDNLAGLEGLAAERAPAFISDLERLRDSVQMEAVVYRIGERTPPEASSGRAYLEEKAGMQRLIKEHAAAVESALKPLSPEIHVREVKNGSRIFSLVRRGAETQFRETIERVNLPEGVSRRVSGPWPAAEFLSDAVKSPQIAGRQ